MELAKSFIYISLTLAWSVTTAAEMEEVYLSEIDAAEVRLTMEATRALEIDSVMLNEINEQVIKSQFSRSSSSPSSPSVMTMDDLRIN